MTHLTMLATKTVEVSIGRCDEIREAGDVEQKKTRFSVTQRSVN